jgi:ATP-binding cassette subfamily C (CFTR/MRP) protein 1
MEKYQYSQMKKKDERVRLITEILNGIKVLKLYGWEISFIGRIKEIRDEEVHELKIFQFLEASQFFAWTSAPLMVALASFATFVLIDPVNNILDSQTAFVSLTLFNTMRGPLFLLPFGIVSIIQGAVSMGRINHYLNLEELNLNNVSPTILVLPS